jgi:twitching motility protein PilT
VKIEELLKIMIGKNASDLHLLADTRPHLRIDGQIVATDLPVLSKEDVANLADQLFNERTRSIFERLNEVDFAFDFPSLARFRSNIYKQMDTVAIAIRYMTATNLDLEYLNLPDVIKKIVLEPRGLIIVTGATGSGKTTTLAAMINFLNRNYSKSIISIEDPVEIVHANVRSIISQREIGEDTESFAQALKHILRQDPDVIVIGEVRDLDTVMSAMRAAETGHLVMSTLHTSDAADTVNRIIDMHPAPMKKDIRSSLAMNLKGILSMRLLRAKSGGRIPAVEVLVGTDRIREAIMVPEKTMMIPQIIQEGGYYGMQTFDQAVLKLLTSDKVSVEEAILHSSSKQDFKLSAIEAGISIEDRF